MATITTIQESDLITNSRAVINDNFANLNNDKIETSVLDTDTTLAANSDSKIATQKAVKAYVDSGGNQNASTTQRGIVQEATADQVKAGTSTGSTGARLFVTPETLLKPVVTEYTTSGSPHTWTKLGGLLFIDVELWAGGGSGGWRNDAGGRVGAGGGGAYIKKRFYASELGSTETVTIGAGGVARTSFNNGAGGGNTTFGSLLFAEGGKGGFTTSSVSGDPASGGDGGRGGISSALNVLLGILYGLGGSTLTAQKSGIDSGAGGSVTGAGASVDGGDSKYGGAGGGSLVVSGTERNGGVSIFAGNGGKASNANGVNADSGVFPSGGGGAWGNSGGAGSSGAGAAGMARVTEYY
jgi:hypothetical protein